MNRGDKIYILGIFLVVGFLGTLDVHGYYLLCIGAWLTLLGLLRV